MGFQRIFRPRPNKRSSSSENTSKLIYCLKILIYHTNCLLEKNNPKGIIVKFISHKKKTQLYKKRTDLKKIKLADMFPGSSSAAIANSKGIFINENLTPFRKKNYEKSKSTEERQPAVKCLDFG